MAATSENRISILRKGEKRLQSQTSRVSFSRPPLSKRLEESAKIEQKSPRRGESPAISKKYEEDLEPIASLSSKVKISSSKLREKAIFSGRDRLSTRQEIMLW